MRKASPTPVKRNGYSLLELLVVIGIISILLGLTLAAVQKVRVAAARLQCTSNLKQIGIALHGYHGSYLTFPNGCSVLDGKSTEPHMSWHTRLLPYLEQEALWRQSIEAFKQDPFFESDPHKPIFQTIIKQYVCPTDPKTQELGGINGLNIASTDYLGVSGTDRRTNNGILFMDSKVRIADITDGTSNTIIVGERPPSADGIYGWWYAGWGQKKDGSGDMILGAAEYNDVHLSNSCPRGPYQYKSGTLTDQCDTFHFWSLHTGGANFLKADGSVSFISYSNSPIFPYLSVRSGREKAVSIE